MLNISDGKIWRYMDLAKFTSLLASRSIYFACPNQFSDPYEGTLPKSHIEAESGMLQKFADDLLVLRPQFIERGIPGEHLDAVLDDYAAKVGNARQEASLRFGISCWHESDYESEAMWKLYSASGQAVAIESTISQLKASLGELDNLQIDRVRYMDFEQDPIEKGHRHYGLFIKRKSFEHEKEVRATVLLPTPGKGVLISCDLDILVTAVHVSPLVGEYLKEAIEALCTGATHRLNKPVRPSPLLTAPDYGIAIKTK